MADEKCNTDEEYIADSILSTEEMKKLFVGGIATDSKDEDVKAFFEKICDGTVTEHVIIRKDTPKKNLFGFLTFESSEKVDEVLFKRKDLIFNSRSLDVNRAVPKNNTNAGAHEKTKKLFIANIPKSNCSEEDLKHYFDVRHKSKYGTIESVQLIKKKDAEGNKTEENKGFGFVMVSSEDLADKMAIQHATFEFGGRKIELRKFVPMEGDKGRGRGRGGRGATRGGRGGNRGGGGGGYQGGNSYGGGYGGGYAQDSWGTGYAQYDPYAYGGGYEQSYGGGYGYGASPRGGRGGMRGQMRYAPY